MLSHFIHLHNCAIYLLDTIRLLKRVEAWTTVGELIQQGLECYPDDPRLSYEGAVLYERRQGDLPREHQVEYGREVLGQAPAGFSAATLITGQAEAGSLFVRARLVASIESLEYPVQLVLRDADAGVVDRETYLLERRAGAVIEG